MADGPLVAPVHHTALVNAVVAVFAVVVFGLVGDVSIHQADGVAKFMGECGPVAHTRVR